MTVEEHLSHWRADQGAVRKVHVPWQWGGFGRFAGHGNYFCRKCKADEFSNAEEVLTI